MINLIPLFLTLSKPFFAGTLSGTFKALSSAVFAEKDRFTMDQILTNRNAHPHYFECNQHIILVTLHTTLNTGLPVEMHGNSSFWELNPSY